jgi:hypothetical protein
VSAIENDQLNLFSVCVKLFELDLYVAVIVLRSLIDNPKSSYILFYFGLKRKKKKEKITFFVVSLQEFALYKVDHWN